MDAFTAAFRIPNLLRDLFAEGALSTAFVTTFSKTIARGGDAGRLAAGEQGGDADGAGAWGCCASPAWCSPTRWSRCWRRDSTAEKAALTAQLTRIMFPFILLVSLAALVMGMLNAKNVFGMPAMASSFFNIGSIVGGVTPGLLDRSALRSARADRPGVRHGDRRRAAAGGAIAVARASGLSLPAGFSLARCRASRPSCC